MASESHPERALVRVAVWVSAAVNINPFHEYGSSVLQMVIFVKLVTVGSTVRFNVASESHPDTTLVSEAIWVSAFVNVNPFHV